MTFGELLSLVSAILAATSGISTIVALVRKRRDLHKSLEGAEEAVLNARLATLDLGALSSYLYDELGDTKIGALSSNPMLRKKVTSVLDAVVEYVGTDAEVRSESDDVGDRREQSGLSPARIEAVHPELSKSVEEIRGGAAWNGLARMRRLVEVTLRELARREGLEMSGQGVGQLLRNLDRADLLPPGMMQELQYPIQIANAGIHGEDVDTGQAIEAVLIVDRVLARWSHDHYE